MSEFVLVAGAWLGASAWDEVVPALRAAGHGCRPLTLPGLAEKSGEPAGQQDHVQAVVDEIEKNDLREVVLVGHSYAGIPVGQASVRVTGRLSHVVFVDSEVPVDGVAFSSGWSQEKVNAEITGSGGVWAPPADAFEGQDLTDEQVARILAGSTPHPGATLTEPAMLTHPLRELSATYVKCLLDGAEPNDAVAELLTEETWRLVEMRTGHWPMFSQPRELTRILLDTTRHDPARELNGRTHD